jgi:hypothetical protein
MSLSTHAGEEGARVAERACRRLGADIGVDRRSDLFDRDHEQGAHGRGQARRASLQCARRGGTDRAAIHCHSGPGRSLLPRLVADLLPRTGSGRAQLWTAPGSWIDHQGGLAGHAGTAGPGGVGGTALPPLRSDAGLGTTHRSTARKESCRRGAGTQDRLRFAISGHGPVGPTTTDENRVGEGPSSGERRTCLVQQLESAISETLGLRDPELRFLG